MKKIEIRIQAQGKKDYKNETVGNLKGVVNEIIRVTFINFKLVFNLTNAFNGTEVHAISTDRG